MLNRAARWALRKLSADRVLTRRLPVRLGGAPILVSPDSALSYWRRDLDRSNGGHALAAAERVVRPGDRVFDIGANLGLFGFAAAHLAGPTGDVVCLEPDPFFVHLLTRSAQMAAGARARVTAFQAAASDTAGVARFVVARHGRSSNYLKAFGGRDTAGGGRAEFGVLCVTLDWLAEHAGPPTVIKIDVEGAEAAVLRGATATLTRHRPRLVVEVGNSTTAEVERLLTAANYRMFGLDRTPLATLAGYDGDVYAEPAS